jgi:hypothetical protein
MKQAETTTYSFETFVDFKQNIRPYIPKDGNLHNQQCEKLTLKKNNVKFVVQIGLTLMITLSGLDPFSLIDVVEEWAFSSVTLATVYWAKQHHSPGLQPSK